MTGRTILLNDGTELVGVAGLSSGMVMYSINQTTIADMFPLFSDPDKTSRVIFRYGEEEDIYNGYTEISALIKDDEDVKIIMEKGAAQDVYS